jgi:hypothetical protein
VRGEPRASPELRALILPQHIARRAKTRWPIPAALMFRVFSLRPVAANLWQRAAAPFSLRRNVGGRHISSGLSGGGIRIGLTPKGQNY